MVTFRNNNNRRTNFRRNDRNFKQNSERQKFNSNFASNDNFKRKAPGRNNHNASKLIEKYNDLAREASSNGDKILSENYLQHADHFMRILNERESLKREKFLENKDEDKEKNYDKISNVQDNLNEISEVKTSKNDSEVKDIAESQVEIT